MPQLIFYLEGEYPQIHEVVDKKTTIGRSRENTIRLNDTRVSAFHAEINKQPDGSYHIVDLGSHNGIKVNGEKHSGIALKNGDQIRFGLIRTLFVEASKVSPSSVVAPLKTEQDEKLQKKIASLKEDHQSLKVDCDKALKEKEDLESKIHSLRKELEKTKPILLKQTKANEAIAMKLSQAKEIESKTTEVKQQLEHQEKTKEALESEIESRKKELAVIKNDLETNQSKQRELEKLTKDLESQKAEKEKLSGESVSILGAIDSNKKDLEETRKNLESKRKELESTQQELKAKQGDLEKTNDEFTSKKEQLEKTHQEIESKQSDLEKILADISSKESELKKYQEDVDHKKNELQNLAATSSEKQKLFDDKERALLALTTDFDAKQKQFDELDAEARKNEETIRNASKSLEEIESKYTKLNSELANSLETQQSLKQKCSSLALLITEKSSVLRRLENQINSRTNGARITSNAPPLRLIDPSLQSLVHYFHQGAGEPESSRILPIGFNSLAACTKGSIHRDIDSVFEGEEPLLILLDGDLDHDRQRIASISSSLPGRTLLVSWPEGRLSNLASQIGVAPVKKELNNGAFENVRGFISVDTVTANLIDKDLQVKKPHLNLFLPCPLDISDWNFSIPIPDRSRGIFIYTDGYDPLSPLHKTRVEFLNQLIAKTQPSVTLFQNDETPAIPALSIPDKLIQRVEGPINYLEYLELMAQHQITAGFGKNFMGGEVIGDTLMTRTMYVGANSDNFLEEHLFPDTCLSSRNGSIPSAVEEAAQFLSNDDGLRERVMHARTMGAQHVSFEVGRDRIGDFVNSLSE